MTAFNAHLDQFPDDDDTDTHYEVARDWPDTPGTPGTPLVRL